MGKCPYCKQQCYVPSPRDEIEEIPLAPIDHDQQRKEEQLAWEDAKLRERLLEETEVPGERPAASGADGPEIPRELGDESSELTVEEMIQLYILHMVRGRLGEAESVARRIAARGPKVLDVIDDAATVDLVHPELADVPTNVIAGFFRRLRKHVSQ